jgi:IS30 family transposase
LKHRGYSYADIGKALGRNPSGIWYEVTHHQVKNVYDAKKAVHKAYLARRDSKYQAMKIVEHPDLRTFVERELYRDQSPENIAGRIKTHERHLPHTSKESIYRYIGSVYGRRIEYHRVKKKARRRRRRSRTEKLTERTFIEKRPAYINKRMRIGHAEADFIVSGDDGEGIMLTVVDRKIRVAFLELILKVTIDAVHRAFLRIKKRYLELRTITTDNDILFRHHRELARLLSVKIYFCHPYHSWEKGSIEHVNGIIRRTIPKGSNLSKYSRQFVRALEGKLNNRFMKCLGYRTPAEALHEARKQKNSVRDGG